MQITSRGDFNNIETWLKRTVKKQNSGPAEKLARMLTDRLKASTPVGSGKTAQAWDYTITQNGDNVVIEIINSNINKGVSIARIIHYGHGTGTGGYVPPRPYITQAINDVWSSQIGKMLEEMIK